MEPFAPGTHACRHIYHYGRYVGRWSNAGNEGPGECNSSASPAPGRQGLVNSLSSDLQERTKNREKLETPKIDKDQAGADGREPARAGLQQIAALVDEKCSPEEAAGFKEWLVELAQVVAKADKEGSHFGMGGVQVSDKEKAALAELKTYLGL